MQNKNSILKDALVLFAITLISGLALGFVHQITKKPIEDQKMSSKKAAYQAVYQDASNFRYNDDITELVEDSSAKLDSYGNITIDEVVEAVDASDGVIGYVAAVTTKDGYNGDISLSVGLSTEGIVLGIEILEISETAGLGLKANEAEFKDQYKNKTVESFKVTKQGKSSDQEIDCISGATITSDAVTNAVNGALYFVNDCMNQ